jgi:hypothetical protein
MAALFPSQTASFDERLAEDLNQVPEGRAKTNGIDLGHRAAEAILALRANDGSQHAEPRVGVDFITNDAPGKWRQDPISRIPIALGAYWGGVKPFVLESPHQFRVPPPPALDSPEYAAAFDEAKRLGGDGVVTPTVRTGDETIAGIYWAMTERRACARRLGYTTRSPCTSPTRWARTSSSSRGSWHL